MYAKLDKADLLFSLYIRTRDGWTCQRCFKTINPPTKALHCSHFQGRVKENTRFDVRNCDALCSDCHGYFTRKPVEHYNWQVKRKGQEMVDAIILAGNQYKKRNRPAEALYWKQKLQEEFDIN